jgi:hypothetical protein
MPEFREFDVVDRYVDPDDIIPRWGIYHPYFLGSINIDNGNDNKLYMYGYISSSFYYDDAVAVSDDIYLDETRDGRIKVSSMRKAYKTIVKQLTERYKQWTMENIVE